jgi:glycosyltransferase involved in cell wall biosynthesis
VVAALEPHKGHAVLVRAAQGILKAVPETLFVFVGDGSVRRSLARQVVDAGIGARFRFTGFRSDPAVVTSLLTVAVAPSLEGEGSSAAIKEAMALGVAVVASDLEGHHEVAGDAAVFVPIGDPDALTEGVVRVLTDPSERGRLIELALDRVERFRPPTMVLPTLEVYRSLVPGRSSVRGVL